MQSSRETVEIVDSMKYVEFDVEKEIFRAEYDSDHDPTSLAVVAVIAAADDRDPVELTALHATINTGALDELFAASVDGARRSGRISFSYEGFDVTVFSEGTIEANPRDRSDRRRPHFANGTR